MVVKSERTPTKVRHVVLAKKVRLEITKFLCKNFGNTKSYKTTQIFVDSNQIAPEKVKELNKKIDDINNFMEECSGRIVLETSYPYFIIEDERKRFLDLLFALDTQIAYGESMYPTSEFLLNKKLDHIQNSINIAEAIINEFDHCIHTFNNKNTDLSKFDWYLDTMDELVSALKDWRSRTNKFREICIHADREIDKNVDFSITQGISARNSSGDMKNVKEYNREVRIARGDLIVDENGKCIKPQSSKNKKAKPAVIFTDPFKVEIEPIKMPAPGFTELPRPAVIFDSCNEIFHPTFKSQYILSA